jgi:hypothetical protein
MYPLSHKERQEFMTLWNRTNPNPLFEQEAEKKAQKILSLVSLIVYNPTKKHDK